MERHREVIVGPFEGGKCAVGYKTFDGTPGILIADDQTARVIQLAIQYGRKLQRIEMRRALGL